MTSPAPTIWTIGHSTRTIDEFVAVITAHDIELIADVRRFPDSRRLPHFGSEPFGASLADAGIGYRWLPALGGRRRPDPESPNVGWRHPAFRAYADHLATEEFANGLLELLMLAHGLRTAVMCSELLWWRCHRRLIADVCTWLGYPVINIHDAKKADAHSLSAPARIVRGQLTYTATASSSRTR